ncbi:MAG: hypothetical protein ACK56I_29135, partial [bacterium]
VHAARQPLGEGGALAGGQRVLQRGDHAAVLPVGRPLAGEHQVRPLGVGHDVVHAPRVLHQGVGHHGLGLVIQVHGEHPVAAGAGPQVGDLAGGVQPHLLGGELHPRQPSHHGGGAPHVARRQRHHRLGAHAAQRRGHAVGQASISSISLLISPLSLLTVQG